MDYHKVYDIIKSSNNILLTTHDAPDGDALSSACIMIELLEAMKKSYAAYCYDAPPSQFDFLPCVEKIVSDKSKFNFSDFDLIIALDCGGINRTKLAPKLSSRSKSQIAIEIDHHPKLDDYADYELRDPQAAATTEVLYRFFKANDLKITKNIANCILTGILTDTGNFLYPSTSQETVKIASEMLKRGARLPQIMKNTWRNKSLTSMKVWGTAMSRLKINQKYNFAHTVLTLEDVRGVTEEEIEGLSGFISNLHNVKGILLLREQPDGMLKGSLRTSRNDVNLTALAALLGGGGHRRASGFKIKGKLAETGEGWKVK